MGMIDDFSYVKSAFVFADTHRLAYNGWATAMIGWQIAWGGLFAQIFGHTFTAVRLSTFVTAFFTVWLAQAVFVRGGLSRRNAVVGALALGLSPIFLPLSVSFMTDISGLFSILLCLYGCLRALEAKTDKRVIAWLIAAAALSIIGATARQIAWMSPLVMVPSAAWLLRRRRGVVPVGIVLWIVAAACMFWSMRWFAHQPLSVPEGIIQGRVDFKSLRELLGNMTAAVLCLLLLLLPLLAAWTTKRIPKKSVLWVLGGTALLTIATSFLTFHNMEKGWAPWTGDVLDKIGMMDYRNAWFLGVGPSAFAPWSRRVLSVVVIAVALHFIAALVRDGQAPRVASKRIDWRPLLVLTVPFLLAYFALLAPRGMWNNIIDRYLLPVVAIGALFLLRLYQERVSSQLPSITYALLAVFALFGVAGTHDWVAQHRARLDAVTRLQAMGVPRTGIEAGYEADGITQIDLAGAVIDKRVTYPAGTDTAPYRPAGLPHGCEEIFNPHTPVIHAAYFLAASEVKPCLVDSAVPPQTFTAWLPPFHRQILILKRP